MLLELKNVRKFFPIRKGLLHRTQSYVRAVNDVDLSVSKKENLSLVGESGCGKTTLGRVILKLLPLDSGQITFEDQDITRLSPKDMRPYRKNIQMIFQDPYSSLDPRFTIRNIIKEAMIFDRKLNKKEKEEKIVELLSFVKLPGDIFNRFPHEFSGAERQRIAIARALAVNPKLLILDEATSSLDVLVQNQIIELLSYLQTKFDITYLFISHNLRVVKKISSKIAVMYQGRIVELGTTSEIFNNPLHPYTQELLSAAIQYKVTKRIQNIPLKEDARLVDKGNGHLVMEEMV